MSGTANTISEREVRVEASRGRWDPLRVITTPSDSPWKTPCTTWVVLMLQANASPAYSVKQAGAQARHLGGNAPEGLGSARNHGCELTL